MMKIQLKHLFSRSLFLVFFITFFSIDLSAQSPSDQQVLIFSKTEGFRHGSIETGTKALQQLATNEGINTRHTEDSQYFHPDSLSSYDAVIFLNTTGNVLNDSQEDAFEQYIQNGGGYLGIHSAADTEYEWSWYGDLVGAYFVSHPHIQEATIDVVDQSHRATSFLPKEWKRTDEWYNYKNINDKINVLMELDESSYEGGENGDFHPIAWYHEFDGGRAFYTGGGHTEESYSEDLFMDHLREALHYVIGNKK